MGRRRMKTPRPRRGTDSVFPPVAADADVGDTAGAEDEGTAESHREGGAESHEAAAGDAPTTPKEGALEGMARGFEEAGGFEEVGVQGSFRQPERGGGRRRCTRTRVRLARVP